MGIWLVSSSLKAQESSLALNVLRYCEYITGSNPQITESVNLLFNQDTLIIKDFRETKNESKLIDSVFSFKKTYNNQESILFQVYKSDKKIYFTIYTSVHSEYSTSNKSTFPEFKRKSNLNISFTEMQLYWGKIFASKIQPKDTYNSWFIYTNPLTGKKAKIKVLSFNPPNSPFNIIYAVDICNVEIDGLIL